MHRYAVAWFDEDWTCTEFPHVPQAFDFIEELMQASRRERRKDDFRRALRQSDQLERSDGLSLVLDAWRSGIRDVEQLAVITRQHLSDRYVVTAPTGPRNRFSILGQGKDFHLLGQDWLSRAEHLLIRDWPDQAFGSWVEEHYAQAWEQFEPRIEDIDCFIEWPGIGSRRHGYRRVILPCQHRGSTDQRVLFTALRQDQSIDLRVQLH